MMSEKSYLFLLGLLFGLLFVVSYRFNRIESTLQRIEQRINQHEATTRP